MDDLDLLTLEARTIWGHRADRGLGDGTVHVTAVAYDGRGRTIPGATSLGAADAAQTTLCRSWLLRPPSMTRSSPSDWVGSGAGNRIVSAGAVVHVTSEPGSAAPPESWSDGDWDTVVAGDRGPFVAAVVGDQVVSLAHCARLTDEAAEVGVQTENGWTGRGLATACVRAWTTAMPRDLVLFYSAMEDNPASHRIATACHARPLGRMVRLAVSG